MRIYQLNGESFIVHEGKVYVELSPIEQAVRTEERPTTSPKAVKGKKGVRRCKACGEAGHRSDNCPTKKSNSAEKPISGMSAEDIKEKIAELKADGLTSVEVAKELGCTLQLVNRYW
jgi:hypothetical protein